MSQAQFGNRDRRPASVRARLTATSLVGFWFLAGVLPLPLTARASDERPADHLVISEVVTGGVGASDELIELFNPTAHSVPLAGLEVVYVSGSGTTVTRRVAWTTGSVAVPPGGHVLLANQAGVHATVADFVYSGGMAASGGSVALRAEGASTAIDAVGWGSAAGWLEGVAAPAPLAGSSIERLPGGAEGSWQDTDDNAHDFAERLEPDPRGLSSPPLPVAPSPLPKASPSASIGPSAVASPSFSVTPSATAVPSSSAAPSPTAETSGTPSASPSGPAPSPSPATPPPFADPIPIDAARSRPNGTVVTVEGIALTAHDFADGGGYVADSTGAIAVLVERGASFQAGARLRVTGPVSDRFSQRTLRPEATGVVTLGAGTAPAVAQYATGAIGESVEGRLVRLDATIRGAPTLLSAATAFEVDDGTGPIKVLVGTATGINTAAWQPGMGLVIIGVVGQRDSTGTGTQGYRVQPRSAFDVVTVAPAETPSVTPVPPTPVPPTPAPVASTPPAPHHDGAGAAGVVSIALARQAPVGDRLTVRGVVTMPPGVIEPEIAFIQDATAGIMLRLADGTPPLRLGQLLVAEGARSTRAGMATLRLTAAPLVIGEQAQPTPQRLTTAGASEAAEGNVVRVIGTLDASARRASSGTVSFEVDDGSGPLRVVLPAALAADRAALVAGARVEVVGVLGQETTASAPQEGYRVWPASTTAVRVITGPPGDRGHDPVGTATSGSRSTARYAAGAVRSGAAEDPVGGPAELRGVVGAGDLTALRVGATVVALEWAELGVGGLLWDGHQLAAVSVASAGALHDAIGGGAVPVAVIVTGLAPGGVLHDPEMPVVALTRGAPGVSLPGTATARPRRALPEAGEPSAWVALTGRLTSDGDSLALDLGAERLALDVRCKEPPAVVAGIVTVTGVGTHDPRRVVVPCDGVRAAPVLLRDGPHQPTRVGSVTSRAGDAATPPPSEPIADAANDSRRGLAGALLVSGMIGLLAGVVAARRLPQPAPGHDHFVGNDDLDERAEADASNAAPADAPHLGLLPLPRNRGSP